MRDVLLVGLGGVLAILGAVVTTWQQGRAAENVRRRARADGAMVEILRLTAAARDPFLRHAGYDADGPAYDEYASVLREIELHIPLITEAGVREEVTRAMKCLRGYWGARDLAGLTAYQAGQLAYVAVSDAVGRVVRGERFAASVALANACAAIDEYDELMREAHRSERARYVAESKSSAASDATTEPDT